MTINFAWPICHRREGDYQTLSSAVARGQRAFRQPVSWSTDPFVIDGLELFLSATPNAHQLFACFSGMLTYYQADTPYGQVPALKLRFDLDSKVSSALGSLRTLEPAARAVHYLNVDPASVRAALTDRISKSYDLAKQNPKQQHPILTIYMRDLGPILDNSLFRLLDSLPTAADRASRITTVVNDFINGSGQNSELRLPILVGDQIGLAAAPKAGASPPASIASPRQLILRHEERCGYLRNPSYDLWHWSRAVQGGTFSVSETLPGQAQPVTSRVRNAQNVLHPLLSAAAVDPASASRPLARVGVNMPAPIGGQLYSIPTASWMAIFHDPSTPTHTVSPTSKFHWLLEQDAQLKAKIYADGSSVNLAPSSTQLDLPRQVWEHAQFGPPIRQFSWAFQVPSELIIASLLIESGGGQGLYTGMERAVRLEEYYEEDIIKSVGMERFKQDRHLIYSQDQEYRLLVFNYRSSVPEGDPKKRDGGVGGLKVPSPWDATKMVNPNQGFLTWGQLVRLLELSPYVRMRVSIGLLQALVGSAMGVTNWIGSVYNDIAAAGTQPAAPTWWGYFGVDQPPSNPGEYLTSWLINPRNAILLGTALVRNIYNNSRRETFWDPPRIAACLNAGDVYDSKGSWGMRMVEGYVDKMWGRVYNAAVLFLNSSSASPRPQVRLMR